MKRTIEFVLGLIGGILGILCAVLVLFFGGFGTAIDVDGADQIIILGWGAVFSSILGIIGSVVVKSKSGIGGAFMLIAAIIGFLCIFAIYILPGALLAIGGLMGLLRKDKASTSV
ncbi:DUF4064 domain-containing protein (plasmid) [Bacillus cereus]|uniref:DUF4064 domain-containing protein n=1 Tax=Bacillus cereus (strain ZK / E33L) TaxID=288681 RepID=Q4V1S6_BACCZ|nr:DUF4064 domain-containing protein [Bacillus cereus]AAY60331.1 conserved hypothetical protein [Bacillus cereus E33L]AJI26011.1 hypothetical protein BF28_5618 [Bacillus cereus E33L]QQA19141.1 DUF4064 domain-containing protein [Bacillus cereus]